MKHQKNFTNTYESLVIFAKFCKNNMLCFIIKYDITFYDYIFKHNITFYAYNLKHNISLYAYILKHD